MMQAPHNLSARTPAARTPRAALCVRALPGDVDPLRFVEALDGQRCRWFLDSALETQRLGRFSFAGADPYAVLRISGTRSVLETHREVRPDFAVGQTVLEGDPLELVRSLLPPPPTPITLMLAPVPFISSNDNLGRSLLSRASMRIIRVSSQKVR